VAALNDVVAFGLNVGAVLMIMAELAGIRKDGIQEIPYFN
jgi:hypothetical protein